MCAVCVCECRRINFIAKKIYLLFISSDKFCMLFDLNVILGIGALFCVDKMVKEYAVKFCKRMNGDRTEINESKWIWAICIDSEIYCNKIGFFISSEIGWWWWWRWQCLLPDSILCAYASKHKREAHIRESIKLGTRTTIMAAQKWKWNIMVDLYYFIFTLTRKT